MFTAQQYTVDLSVVEALRADVSHYFTPADTTFDYPEDGAFRIRGRLAYDPDVEDGFLEIQNIFAKQGFTAQLRPEDNGVALIGLPYVQDLSPNNWRLSIFLFLATVATTFFVGGWEFSVSILAILLAHEFGHYFAAVYHKVPASPPFFIPMPLSIIGTMGAVIIQKGPTRNIRVQFDFGAAGPLVGLVVALPILIFGLMSSEVGPMPDNGQQFILEGNSLIYAGLKTLIFGQFLPDGNMDVQLNSVAWAGWVGLLVTGLNLIPVSPLDGGRILHVIFGEQSMRYIYWPIIGFMLIVSVVTQTYFWVFWAGLLFLFGNRYEVPHDTVTPLDPRRRALAWLTFGLFFLLFVPTPLQIMGG